MNVQKVTDAIVGISMGGGDYATPEDFRRMAKEITIAAMDSFSGDLLHKAVDVAYAIVEFADELETKPPSRE